MTKGAKNTIRISLHYIDRLLRRIKPKDLERLDISLIQEELKHVRKVVNAT